MHSSKSGTALQLILIPDASLKVIMEAQQKLEFLQGQIASYAAGLRHGMNVPDTWQLDLSKKAFVPPVPVASTPASDTIRKQEGVDA